MPVPLIGWLEKVRFNPTKSGRVACLFSAGARVLRILALAGLCRFTQPAPELKPLHPCVICRVFCMADWLHNPFQSVGLLWSVYA